MTEKRKKQAYEPLDIDQEISWEKSKKRNQRRRIKAKKNAKLYALVSQHYIPQAGYVPWDQQGNRYSYVKYPNHSNCQRWIKRESNRSVRRYDKLPHKGAHYRRLVDYWGILY